MTLPKKIFPDIQLDSVLYNITLLDMDFINDIIINDQTNTIEGLINQKKKLQFKIQPLIDDQSNNYSSILELNFIENYDLSFKLDIHDGSNNMTNVDTVPIGEKFIKLVSIMGKSMTLGSFDSNSFFTNFQVTFYLNN